MCTIAVLVFWNSILEDKSFVPCKANCTNVNLFGFIKLWYLININVVERKNTQSFPKSCSYSNICWLIEAYCFLVLSNVLQCIITWRLHQTWNIWNSNEKIASVVRWKVLFYEQTWWLFLSIYWACICILVDFNTFFTRLLLVTESHE